MNYEKLQPISRREVKDALDRGDAARIADALLRMSLSDPDWNWAEDLCLKSLNDHRPEVKAAALVALGHLARLHRVLHLDRVLPRLKELLHDPEWAGRAEDVLDDIAVFVPVSHS